MAIREEGCRVKCACRCQGACRGPRAARRIVELGIPHDGAGAGVSAREKHLTVLKQGAGAVVARAASRRTRRGQRPRQRERSGGGIKEVGGRDGAAGGIPTGEQDLATRQQRDRVVVARERERSGDRPRAAGWVVYFRLVQSVVGRGTAVLWPAGQEHLAVGEERGCRTAPAEAEGSGCRPGVEPWIVELRGRAIRAIRVAQEPRSDKHLAVAEEHRAVVRAHAEGQRRTGRPAVGQRIVKLGGIGQRTGGARVADAAHHEHLAVRQERGRVGIAREHHGARRCPGAAPRMVTFGARKVAAAVVPADNEDRTVL